MEVSREFAGPIRCSRFFVRDVARCWTLLLALLAGWMAGCDFPGRPRAGDRYVPPREVKAFDALFGRSCAGCHGADGKLGPAPPLNDPLFLAQIPDAELRRVIAEGRHGTLMPAFATSAGGELTAEQVDILAEGIKKRWRTGRAGAERGAAVLARRGRARWEVRRRPG